MFDLLITPAAPYVAFAIACLLMAGLGARRRLVLPIGLVPPAHGWDYRQRLVRGQLAGSLVAALVVAAVLAQNVQGTPRLLALLLAAMSWLYLGLAVPRRPQVAADKRRKAVRRLLPGFIAFLSVSLVGRDTPLLMLRRYTERTDRASPPLREVIAAALEQVHRARVRPFQALHQEAQKTGSRELIDLADALEQAEADGAPLDEVLQRQQTTLQQILDDEFKRLVKRRTMYLLLLVAIAVVVGILMHLLVIFIGSALVGRG